LGTRRTRTNQTRICTAYSKRKRDKKEKEEEVKILTQQCSYRKKRSAKRWVLEKTNS
jgi:hypothetical protein